MVDVLQNFAWLAKSQARDGRLSHVRVEFFDQGDKRARSVPYVLDDNDMLWDAQREEVPAFSVPLTFVPSIIAQVHTVRRDTRV